MASYLLFYILCNVAWCTFSDTPSLVLKLVNRFRYVNASPLYYFGASQYFSIFAVYYEQ